MNTPVCGAMLIGSTAPELLEKADLLAPAIRALAGDGYICTFYTSEQVLKALPRYIAGDTQGTVVCLEDTDTDTQLKQLSTGMGDVPSGGSMLVVVGGLGVFGVGESPAAARSVFEGFITGSPSVHPADTVTGPAGRVHGKIALVTGGAQGFGKGIAKRLVEEGACVVIADKNAKGAYAAAQELACGFPNIIGWEADVADEESTKRMIMAAVLEFGGLDIFINNAGINTPGDLENMDLATFERISRVNLAAYFLGAKYASRVMKRQHRFAPDRYADIIQINSKSGIAGSNKNFAYAASKFGGIGLTQSLALELVSYNIKVNSICPGNFFESPLWSDPEKGMFALYLKTGKVPGAKTIDDVRSYYEEKVPMGRGCRAEDVARAVLYLVEQVYETGQALPVTGGQVMLK